ncbi:uncharacterized protein LOC110155914 isoform X2 [Boleophthalmus pectinirostris]|uniref:uncharacterized protein LOC110155914 isoform X2 n=1 Tax=Boleophthalmus pectinirostris TaxID=150288 RepID=UPI0024301955|nr:uncharacterized protein LOC110155914 isoform X2 [Boleophthalmus pectinirostris]
MGRLRWRAPSARKKKQDTPLKTGAPRKTGLKKQMGKRTCEVLPEEGELHVHAVHTLQPEVPQVDLVTGVESSDSSSSLGLVIDTSYSSGDQPMLVDSSSTLPSPEIFRDEKHNLLQYCSYSTYMAEPTVRVTSPGDADDITWESRTFPMDLTDSLMPKNSTLLDLSQAETIHTHSPPNLSTIMDAPTILAENDPQDLVSNQRVSDNGEILKAQTPPALLIKKMCFKKQVWFRSPLFSEKIKNTPRPKPRSKEKMRRRAPSSPHQNIEPEVMNTETEDIDGGVFFDFASNSEQESYFSKMRKRCSKLNSTIIFPLTAAKGN